MQYVYDEYTLLEAVVERDIEAVQAIIDDNPTEEELNERDRSGRVSLLNLLHGYPAHDIYITSHLCRCNVIFLAYRKRICANYTGASIFYLTHPFRPLGKMKNRVFSRV